MADAYCRQLQNLFGATYGLLKGKSFKLYIDIGSMPVQLSLRLSGRARWKAMPVSIVHNKTTTPGCPKSGACWYYHELELHGTGE